MNERRRRLADLAASQHGAASTPQAVGLDIPQRTVHHWLRRGDLIRLGARTFTFPGHRITWRTRLAGGVLDVGGGAVVTGTAAGVLLGFDGFAEGPVELLVPREHRSRTTPLGTVHSTRSISPLDVVRVDGFRCTSGALTVIELARRGTRDQVEGALASAVRDGWTSPTFLRRRLEALRHRGRGGVRLLDELLDASRADSWLERRFLELVRAARLPAPATQEAIRTRGGVLVRVDVSWTGAPLTVEVNGHRFHSTPTQLARDERRRAELVAIGRIPVAFTYTQIVTTPHEVIEQLQRLRPLCLPGSATNLAS